MGIAMGLTAILIIHSPMGKSSGAHFNPAITLTYLRLRKIALWDASFYILFQFAGGVFGVGVSALLLGRRLADPSVDYAVTVPGKYGTAAAFAAEFFMAALLMAIVLWMSNRPRVALYTSYAVGTLIALYIVFFAPVSGFSINPARTTGSAVFAHLWTACWLYFAAPLLGMFCRGRMVSALLWRRSHSLREVASGPGVSLPLPLPLPVPSSSRWRSAGNRQKSVKAPGASRFPASNGACLRTTT